MVCLSVLCIICSFKNCTEKLIQAMETIAGQTASQKLLFVYSKHHLPIFRAAVSVLDVCTGIFLHMHKFQAHNELDFCELVQPEDI